MSKYLKSLINHAFLSHTNQYCIINTLIYYADFFMALYNLCFISDK